MALQQTVMLPISLLQIQRQFSSVLKTQLKMLDFHLAISVTFQLMAQVLLEVMSLNLMLQLISMVTRPQFQL